MARQAQSPELKVVPARTKNVRPNAPELVNITLRPADELLLTVEEAARRLSIGRSLMYELIRDGEIATIGIGRLRRIDPDELRAFVSRAKTGETKINPRLRVTGREEQTNR